MAEKKRFMNTGTDEIFNFKFSMNSKWFNFKISEIEI